MEYRIAFTFKSEKEEKNDWESRDTVLQLFLSVPLS